MKRVIKSIKKTPYWCYATIIIIVFVAINIQITSSVTKDIINQRMDNVTDMVITNQQTFTELQGYFQNRYNADGSATYLLQPKDYIKLYKEAVYTQYKDSLFLYVPTKVSLMDEKRFQLDLKKNEFVRMTKDSKYENNFLVERNKAFKTIYVFPIYHYRTHVSELYLFFEDDITLTKSEIIELTSEIQVLARFID